MQPEYAIEEIPNADTLEAISELEEGGGMLFTGSTGDFFKILTESKGMCHCMCLLRYLSYISVCSVCTPGDFSRIKYCFDNREYIMRPSSPSSVKNHCIAAGLHTNTPFTFP